MSGPAHVEPGASWRPVGMVAGVYALAAVLEVLPVGRPVMPAPAWGVAAAVVAVLVAHTLAARRAWTLRLDEDAADPALVVGRERVGLADVDAAHLRAAAEGRAGVDAGAPVLGGAGSLPRGRAGLPLRLAGGRTVLVPTRDPAGLRARLLAAVPDPGAAPGGRPAGVSDATGDRPPDGGTLGS